MNRMAVAKELVAVAKSLAALEARAAEEGEEEAEDPQFAQKVRELKQVMQKLNNRKNRRLKQFGISEMIRPNDTVADLVDALKRCAA